MRSSCFLFLFTFSLVTGDYNLQIIHLNDFHARFEQINAKYSNKCEPGTEKTCIGGISRIFSLSKKIKSTSDNVLFLNAGDNYQGTLWYTLFKWNVTAKFMSQLPFDAYVPGNHDFDDGIEGFVPFLKSIKDTPVVAANMDASLEPTLAPFIKKSTIIKKRGQKIGIIGYDLKQFPDMSHTGNLTFSDEATAVIEEAKNLRDQGVKIIIGLSHAGILKDIEVAQKADLLDVIVGGHSHTFMYTGKPPSYDKALYPYPLVVNQTSGRKVLVVQASAYSKYLGNLSVTFDDDGEIKSYGGNPILLDHTVPTDKKMDSELKPWKKQIDLKGNEIVGQSKVELSTADGVCYRQECNMGNFVTDAMVHSYIDAKHDRGWTQAAVAVINAGGIRTSINKGNVSYADVLAVIPFGSSVDAVSVKGSTLYEAIEYTLSSRNFLQWSGIVMSIDPSKPVGNRVVDLKITCTECRVPELEPVDQEKYYRVILPSFLYEGGDGYKMFASSGINHTTGVIDSDCFFAYLKRNSPVTAGIEERIHLEKPLSQTRKHVVIFG
ncbi:apyrase-like [Lycorma delicatula]|uniref:apyrase-like n=1 Tax=Lycorma delicatula TaxID=130591 RepID=UPI003F516305